jgi:hypothetical protein
VVPPASDLSQGDLPGSHTSRGLMITCRELIGTILTKFTVSIATTNSKVL